MKSNCIIKMNLKIFPYLNKFLKKSGCSKMFRCKAREYRGVRPTLCVGCSDANGTQRSR